MKLDTTKMIALGLIAFAGVWWYTQSKPKQFNNRYYPPAPNPNYNYMRFVLWAKTISAIFQNLYGTIGPLFQPGGPFHRYKTDDIYDVLDTPIPSGTQNPYNFFDPTTGTTGTQDFGWA